MRHLRWSLRMALAIAVVALGAVSLSAWAMIGGAGGAHGAAGAKAAATGRAKEKAAPAPPFATAKLESAEAPNFSGTVTFSSNGDAVRMVADVSGVDKPGPHGFHLHENGKCEHDPAGKHFTTAGGHFNPTKVDHACPESTVHHAGDFGNIEIKADGTGHYERLTSMLSVSGPNSPVGKAVILHTGEDDCKTQPTGNAGARLACGVVKAEGGKAH